MKYTIVAFLIVLTSLSFSIFKDNTKSQVVSDVIISNEIKEQQYSKYHRLLEKIKLQEKMERLNVPGVSIAIIKDGELDWTKGYGLVQVGKTDKIDEQTMFSVGSISKVVAAVASLRLVNQNKLDLDTDVNNYLKSWKVPQNEFTKKKPVTLRRIMSHSAGLTVHGFADYQPKEKLPTTVQILNGEYPAKNSKIYVDIPVGSKVRYSGGGTTVEQLVIEEITRKPFHLAAHQLVFSPLKMNRSSYYNPLPQKFGNIAKAHNRRGNPTALPRGYEAMPEAAASGLWTTPSDLSKVLIALMDAYHHNQENFLTQTLATDVMTPVKPSHYGLGPRIKKEGETIIFSHGGANDSYRANFTCFLQERSGVVIFTNGTRGKELIKEIKPELIDLLKNSM